MVAVPVVWSFAPYGTILSSGAATVACSVAKTAVGRKERTIMSASSIERNFFAVFCISNLLSEIFYNKACRHYYLSCEHIFASNKKITRLYRGATPYYNWCRVPICPRRKVLSLRGLGGRGWLSPFCPYGKLADLRPRLGKPYSSITSVATKVSSVAS